MPFIKVFEIQRDVFQALMGEEWFSRKEYRIKNHPAYIRTKICNKFISQNGAFNLPEDNNIVPLYMASFLEVFDIVKASGAQIDKFDIGSFVMDNFKAYGDEKVQSRIKTVVRNPIEFESLLTELTFGAWCLSKELNVKASEEEGYPDFELTGLDLELPVLVDCKKLMEDTNLEKRVSYIIKKANKQVKRVTGINYGIVFIDASAKVKKTDCLSDSIPSEILQIEELIKHSISNFNTSISAVILCWDDYSNLGDLSEDRSRTFVFRRRSKLFHHKSPRNSLPENTVFDNYGTSLTNHLEPNTNIDLFKQARNSVCICDSGKRYKHCCGSADPAERPNIMFYITQIGVSKNLESVNRHLTIRKNMEDPLSFWGVAKEIIIEP